jgi:hypothetical protein
LERLKTLLTDRGSWVPDAKWCATAGDAAILMTGPYGVVTVMLELWCARATIRDETAVWLMPAHGSIDPIISDLRGLVLSYYPDDPYVQRVAAEEESAPPNKPLQQTAPQDLAPSGEE